MTTFQVTDKLSVLIENITEKERQTIDDVFGRLRNLEPPSTCEITDFGKAASVALGGEESDWWSVRISLEWEHIIDTDTDEEDDLPDYWKDGFKHIARCCKDFCTIERPGSILRVSAERQVEREERWEPEEQNKNFYCNTHGVLTDDDYRKTEGETEKEKWEKGQWKKDPDYWRDD